MWRKFAKGPVLNSGSLSSAASLAVGGRELIERKTISSLAKAFTEIPTVEETLGLEAMDVKTQCTVYQELFKAHGPIFKKRENGRGWTVLAYGPQAAKAMYRAEGRCPSRGRLLNEVIESIHRNNGWRPSLAFTSGDDWKRVRTAARRQSTPKWAWQHLNPLCQMADKLTENLSREREGVEDIRTAVNRWAFQGTAFFVLGEIVEMHDDIDPTHRAVMETGLKFTESLKTIASFSPVDEITQTQRFREFVRTTNTARELGTLLMERRYQKMRKREGTGVFEEWVREGRFSREEAVVLCTDLLASSFETTANIATFLLLELAKQPSLQERLNKEIQDVVGTRTHVIPEDLQRTKLLRECVKETLRLYPPVTVSKREITGETVVNGYQVPAGTNVHVAMSLMSHDNSYFEQPMKFKPERWSQATIIQPYTYLPFGFGPRACYGRRYAEAQLYTLLFRLIPQCILTTDKKTLRIKHNSGTSPAEAVPLTVATR